MGAFIIRRLVQAVFTLAGVMLLTFGLFRLIPGDITARFTNPKDSPQVRRNWLHKNKLDLPMFYNMQRRIKFTDNTKGNKPFDVKDSNGSLVTAALGIDKNPKDKSTLVTRPIQHLSGDTLLNTLSDKELWVARRKAPTAAQATTQPTSQPASQPASQPTTQPSSQPASQPQQDLKAVITFTFRDGSSLQVDLSELVATDKHGKTTASDGSTCNRLIDLLNQHPKNKGRLEVEITQASWSNLHNSQFYWFMKDTVTFQSHSFKTKELLQDIVRKRAVYSLALTIPAMAMGWILALGVSSIVAYYRGGAIDKLGVFICVLGMCVPYLVYMMAGQALVFAVAPKAAWGLHQRINIYVPILISVVKGLGGNVRFYRTVILDEVNRDYVRTARAKGVGLPGILFKHVLKNCMLPILTSLVVSIPFLIMGSLLLENFFGIPGLGSLLVTSVSDRDVPIIASLTFLTAGIYIIFLLITDLLYGVFDPRIRLK